MRKVLVVVAAGVVVACSGGRGGGGGGGPSSGDVLFEDDFAAGYPTDKWVSIGTAAPLVDEAAGNPAPSLLVGSTSSNANQIARMRTPVDGNAGVDVAFDLALVAGEDGANAQVSINDQAQIFGSAHVALESSAGNLVVIYGIAGQSHTVSMAPDATLHRFRFVYTTDGDARWERDGVTAFEEPLTPSDPGEVTLQLQTIFGGVARWDEVVIAVH